MRLCVLSFNVNFQPGFKLHSEVALPDDNSFKPALYQGLVEGLQVCGLLLDKILQLVDAGNLCVSGGSVNRAILALFSEFEDLIGYLIIFEDCGGKSGRENCHKMRSQSYRAYIDLRG